MSSSLILKSDNLHDSAEKLRKHFRFVDLARNYFNDIKLIGSAANNTMFDADIDFNCELDPLDSKIILKFVHDLLQIKECRKVSLYNQLFEDSPHFIINVERFKFEDELWIITFFIRTGLEEAPNLLDYVKANVDGNKRLTILELKKYREENNQKRSIPSSYIYKAVLSENIKTIPNFKKFLEKNGIDSEKKDAY